MARSSSVAALAPWAHAALRIGAGLLFLEHGLQKTFGLLGGTVMPLASRLGVAGVLEVAGGVLIAIGLLTRPVAVVLAGEMIVAYYLSHLPRGTWPIRNGGELALLYALIYAYLAANGPGPLSLDAMVRGRR